MFTVLRVLLTRLYEELLPCVGRAYTLLERTPVVSLLFTVELLAELLTAERCAERCGRTDDALEPSLAVTTRPDELRTVVFTRLLF